MNKAVLILIIASGLVGACFQMVEAVGASEADSGRATRHDLLLMESVDASSAHEAMCKEVEILLDEGYGVSRVEKRSVCRDSR